MTESTSLRQQLVEHVRERIQHNLDHAEMFSIDELKELAFAIIYLEQGDLLSCLDHYKTFAEL